MLMHQHGMAHAAAEAVAAEYPTLGDLVSSSTFTGSLYILPVFEPRPSFLPGKKVRALDRCPSDAAREGLLAGIRYDGGKKSVRPAVARVTAWLYCDEQVE